MDAASRIASAGDVREDDTFLFTVRNGAGEEREAVLVRVDDEVACWLNYCQHYTHIRLDKGSGAPIRDGEVVCTNHGAMFEADTGRCTFGPCEGAYLNPVSVAVEGGDVFLTDPDYEFVDVGGVEGDGDRSSTSNLEF